MAHEGESAAQVVALQRTVRELRRRLEFVEGSKFWQLRATWLRVSGRFTRRLPIEAPSIPAVDFLETMAWPDPYARWLVENEPRGAELRRLREIAPLLRVRPAIAVLVNDTGGDATAALAAAADQAYPHVRVVPLTMHSTDGDDASRWNAAIGEAAEEVVVFLEPADLLAGHAAFEVALAFNQSPEAIAVYGDSDEIEPDGRRSSPHFAPDWSPDTFLSSMYTGRVIFYRREAVVAAGGFRSGFGAASHYDLALRVFEGSQRVVHRPSVLAHVTPSLDPSSGADARRAVSDALERRGEPGEVVPSGCDGVSIVRYCIVRPGRVEVIVPTRDLAPSLEGCLESIYARNAGTDLRVTVVDNGSVEPATESLFAEYAAREPDRFRVERSAGPFNFSKLINVGVRSTDGPYVLLLNNDAEFISDRAISAMLEQAQRPSIGAVGALLLYPDGSLQHAGVVIGLGGLAGHVYRGANGETRSTCAAVAGVRNYAAQTAAALMVRRDAFESVGGFDERLAVEFNDIDFCLKLWRAGLNNVYLPHVELRHAESRSRGVPKNVSERASRDRERRLFRETWRSDTFVDPYYNPNLTRLREDGTVEA